MMVKRSKVKPWHKTSNRGKRIQRKMKLSLKKGEKGFTLIELMVVMAIIAVLSAIDFPTVTGTNHRQ